LAPLYIVVVSKLVTVAVISTQLEVPFSKSESGTILPIAGVTAGATLLQAVEPPGQAELFAFTRYRYVFPVQTPVS
jgi:hypothetical protein